MNHQKAERRVKNQEAVSSPSDVSTLKTTDVSNISCSIQFYVRDKCEPSHRSDRLDLVPFRSESALTPQSNMVHELYSVVQDVQSCVVLIQTGFRTRTH